MSTYFETILEKLKIWYSSRKLIIRLKIIKDEPGNIQEGLRIQIRHDLLKAIFESRNKKLSKYIPKMLYHQYCFSKKLIFSELSLKKTCIKKEK